jgi:hypothetical protein
MNIVAISKTGERLRVDEVVGDDRGGDRWFYAYDGSDGFDPLRYLVRSEGRSTDEAFSEAWDRLCEHPRFESEHDISTWWGEAEVEQAHADLAAGRDVPGLQVNDNGVELDTESVAMFEVKVRIEREVAA